MWNVSNEMGRDGGMWNVGCGMYVEFVMWEKTKGSMWGWTTLSIKG